MGDVSTSEFGSIVNIPEIKTQEIALVMPPTELQPTIEPSTSISAPIQASEQADIGFKPDMLEHIGLSKSAPSEILVAEEMAPTSTQDTSILPDIVHEELGPRQVLSAMARPVETTETVDKPEQSDDYFKVEKQVFSQEKPIYIKEEHTGETPIIKPLIASQGSGVTTTESRPIYSDRIANCFALILENEKSHQTALFHIDANSPRAVDVGLLNQISEGGGLVVMQAVRGSQSIPSEETKRMFSEYISANVLVADDIQVDTRSGFWDITCFPDKHEFRVHADGATNTFWYTRESQLPSVPEMISPTDEQKIVTTIINDQNIHSYLRQSENTSSEEILASVNTLATFISKDKSNWVDRWVLSSNEEKQVMATQIVRNLNSIVMAESGATEIGMTEAVVQGPPIESTERFHEPKYLSSEYHGTGITIAEFDHRGSTLNGESFSLPPDWKQELTKVLDENPDSAIVPEYCMPDLEQNAFRELGTGKWARQESEGSQRISEFYGLISRYVGSKGEHQLVIDPANTNLYLFAETVESFGMVMPEQIKAGLEKREPEYQNVYAGKYGEIGEKEINRPKLVDARRLITARGLMQEALRSNKKILHINAPIHAERVQNYIERQNDWEAKSTIKVEKPVDQRYVSPTEERRKMIIYGIKPFQRTIREYAPELPPKYFQLEVDIKDTPELAGPIRGFDAEQQYLKQSATKIDNFVSENNAATSVIEQKQLERLKQARDLIEKLLSNSDNDGISFRTVSRLLSTDWAWKMVRKDYVY